MRENKIIFCPMCGEAMKYDPEKDFYECLDGCGEFWPANKEYDAAKMFWQEIRDKKSMITKPGSSSRSSKRRSKKKPVRKASEFIYSK